MMTSDVARLEAERLRPIPPLPQEPRWAGDLRRLIAILAELMLND